MAENRRIERVNRLVKEEVAKLIQLELKDPRLAMASVTRVRTSPDLKKADVYVSVMGGEAEMNDSLKVLRNAAGFLRRELGERVNMKYVPELTIRLDRSLQKGDEVLRIIGELEESGGGEADG